MPQSVLSDHDPLYRQYAQEVSRRGGTPWTYDQFMRNVQDRSDFDFASLFPPAPEGQPLALRAAAEPKFALGQVCITPHAATAIPPEEVSVALQRHAAGDWGRLDAHDCQVNERALRTGGRLVSAFESTAGQKFWIITDAGWQVTTVLLPEDY